MTDHRVLVGKYAENLLSHFIEGQRIADLLHCLNVNGHGKEPKLESKHQCNDKLVLLCLSTLPVDPSLNEAYIFLCSMKPQTKPQTKFCGCRQISCKSDQFISVTTSGQQTCMLSLLHELCLQQASNKHKAAKRMPAP